MSFAYITEEGAYIQKRGGCFTVGRNRECVMEIPAETLEGLTLIDAVQVSSKAIVELLRLGIPVTWLSRTGYFFGRLESTRHVNVFRQERQILLRAYEKKMRATNLYSGGKRPYRHALAHQARQYAQALMAENADIYEPVRMR